MKELYIAEVRFNNGRGALLCNECGGMIDYGFDWEDTLYFCSSKCEMEHHEFTAIDSLMSMDIDPGVHEFTTLEKLLIDQVMQTLAHDDANPDVGMGPAPWMILDDILNAHKIPKTAISYNDVEKRCRLKRAGLA